MKRYIILGTILVIALSLTGGGKNSLSFFSTKISGKDFTLSHVEATKHNMQTSGKKYSAMIIQLANYDRGGGSWHPAPRENGQIRVTVNFSAPSGKKLKAGTYKIGGKMAVDYYFSIGIEGKVDGKTKTVGIYNGKGFAEITHIDDKTITGKFDLKDSKGTNITSNFTTAYTKSMY